MVKYLLQRGVNVNTKEDPIGHTALHVAVAERSIIMAKILFDAGADPLMKDRKGTSPLDIAKRFGPKAIVELLMNKQ